MSDAFAPPVEPAGGVPAAEGRSDTRPVAGLGTPLTLLLSLWTATMGGVLMLEIADMALGFPSMYGVEDDPVSMAMGLGFLGLGGLNLLLMLACGVIWAMWTWRVAKNLQAEGLATTKPGWAVGWWFVPFANLWKPYQVIREHFQASTTLDGDDIVVPGYLGAWWAAWIASGILGQISLRMSLRGAAEAALWLDPVVSVVSLLSGVLAIRVVRDLTARHERWRTSVD